ncbi:hypothetical protein A0H81_10824 [Grifola frondosa]|uniref:Uncharacterized protein n=1 Tax=Grifola frondosa TaxID=5627 RepID=A0A1C7LX02_GRIFR|nr:hypothetical protein A0H81_10824 [Grifola frondosa]
MCPTVSRLHFSQPLPSISITKPPAPLPVDLPSPDGLDSPSGLDRNIPVRHDLESGGNIPMREIDDSCSALSLSSVALTDSLSLSSLLLKLWPLLTFLTCLLTMNPYPHRTTVQTDFASSSGSGEALHRFGEVGFARAHLRKDAAQSNTDTTVKLVGGGVLVARSTSPPRRLLVEDPKQRRGRIHSFGRFEVFDKSEAREEEEQLVEPQKDRAWQVGSGKRTLFR